MEKNISEVAKLFNIPVYTLHYWEQQGLFNVGRNEENRYRTYNLSDILNIWEIMLFREIGVPIKKIHQLLDEDTDGMIQAYEENEKKIKNEMLQLERQLKKISQQKKLLKIKEELEKKRFEISKPDFIGCIMDPFEMDTIRLSLENPYQCILVYDDERECFERGICSDGQQEGMLWKIKEDKQYLECLLKVGLENRADNNIKDIREALQDLGYSMGDIAARYLLSASSCGRRYEYYRAWVEVR